MLRGKVPLVHPRTGPRGLAAQRFEVLPPLRGPDLPQAEWEGP